MIRSWLTLLLLLVGACSGSGVKSDYVLAEKLWQEKNYEAAARQFERIFLKDQKGKLGQQALYRAATTQLLFLRKNSESLKLFQKYLEVVPAGPAARDAQIQIGEIYFSQLQNYEAAIQHYRKWLRENPSAPENAEFLYRVGRSQFFLQQFEEAAQTFETIVVQAPHSSWASEAAYQLGMSKLALAEQPSISVGLDEEQPVAGKKEALKDAVKALEFAESHFPGTPAAKQASLALVTCLEEQGLWEEALQKAQSLGSSYPIPQVVQIRIHRIQERLARRRLVPKR